MRFVDTQKGMNLESATCRQLHFYYTCVKPKEFAKLDLNI